MRHQLALTAALLLSLASASRAQEILHSIQGTALGGQLGAAVAGGGDANHDGIDDVIVGAPTDMGTGGGAGRVLVVSGFDGSPLHSIGGAALGDQFGFAVAFVGDVNLDGFDDFAVGAPGSDAAAANAGRVRVYSGKTGAVLATYNGAAAGDRFGQCVARYSSTGVSSTPGFLVGAPYHDGPGGAAVGAVYRYDGIPAAPTATLVGTWPGEHFGWSVASAAVLGGATQYLVVGAPGYDETLPKQGRVLVCHPLTGAVVRTNLGSPNAELGTSVVSMGDVENNGIFDYAAGGPGTDRCVIFNGSGAVMHTLFGPVGSRYGQSITVGLHMIPTTPPTLAWDQYLAVGAPLADSGGADGGSVTLYRVSSIATLVEWIHSGSAGERLGSALATTREEFVGGFLHRVVAGSPFFDGAGTDSGVARVLSQVNGAPILAVEGTAFGERLGTSVAAMGDLDGDGVPDYAVGSPHAWKNAGIGSIAPDVGAARIHSGASGAELMSLKGGASGDALGAALAGAGDVNGDGTPDLLVGAPFADSTTATGAGEAYVQSGSTGALLATLGGFLAGSEFGAAVATGDANHDGKRDYAIGMPGWSGDAGRVRVISGANGTSVLLDKWGSAGDRFGASVAMGDLNADGFVDLVVGAPQDDVMLANDGRVVAYSGSTGLALWTRWGLAANDLCGSAVAVVGDVNADGLLDVAASAPFGDPGFTTNGGYVRVHHGTNGNVLWTSQGGTDHLFGSSVAAAGDVDLDGHADVLIGASAYPFLAGALGNGYVRLHSGATGLPIHETNSIGVPSGFGAAVAGIGDVNGDGIPDAVVGAPFTGPVDTIVWHGAASVVSLRPKDVTFYGAPTPGCAGAHLATANLVPAVNTPGFGIANDRAPANALGLLLVSDVPDFAGTDLLGIGLDFHVGFGGSLLLGLDASSDAGGFGFAPVPIPNSPEFAGASVCFQTIWSWGGACPLPSLGLSATGGVRIVIQ